MYCRKGMANNGTVLLIDEIGAYKGEVYLLDFIEAITSKELLIEDEYEYFKLNKKAIEVAVENLKKNRRIMKEMITSKWFTYAVIGGLTVLALSVKSCGNSQILELRGKNELLQKQITKVKDGVEVAETIRLRQRDSINAENVKKDKIITRLEERVLESNNNLKKISEHNINIKSRIPEMSATRRASTINTLYGVKDATVFEGVINLKGELPSMILETFYDMHYYKSVSEEKSTQLEIKDETISLINSKLHSTRDMLFEADESIETYKNLNSLNEELNTSLKKENKKLRTKNKYLFPAGVVLGVLTGVIIK